MAAKVHLAEISNKITSLSPSVSQDVHDDEGEDEVVNGGGYLIREFVPQKERDRRLHHEAERVRRQHGRSQYRPVALSDKLHYYNTQSPIRMNPVVPKPTEYPPHISNFGFWQFELPYSKRRIKSYHFIRS